MSIDLPEARRLAGQMDKELRGAAVRQALAGPDSDKLARIGFFNPRRLPELTDRVIEAVEAKGEWIRVCMTGEMRLHMNFSMGGRISLAERYEERPKHHLLLEFLDGRALAVRQAGMGFLVALPAGEMAEHPYAGVFGVEPWGDERFTEDFLARLLADKDQVLKFVLLGTSKWISGFGNGYLQEILYRARLHPARRASSLDGEERRRLYNAIVETMAEAVRLGGSDRQVDLYGQPGGYHKVLGADTLGHLCPACGAPIDKQNLMGSFTYFCPGCQPEPRGSLKGKTNARLWFLGRG